VSKKYKCYKSALRRIMVIMFIISLGFKGVFDRREGEIFLLGRGRLLQGEVVPPLIVLRRGLTSPYRPFS
jgi:hypothetical protein